MCVCLCVFATLKAMLNSKSAKPSIFSHLLQAVMEDVFWDEEQDEANVHQSTIYLLF